MVTEWIEIVLLYSAGQKPQDLLWADKLELFENVMIRRFKWLLVQVIINLLLNVIFVRAKHLHANMPESYSVKLLIGILKFGTA